MRVGDLFGAYITGWKNFVGSCVYVLLWQMTIGLPVVLLVMLAPGLLEGGPADVHSLSPLAIAVLFAWIPVVSYATGMLRFERQGGKGSSEHIRKPNIERLRAIVPDQEKRAEEGPEETS
ncbi:MAG: hypothetical protein ACOC7T_04780 [Planctomycetota bacterium]